MYMYMYAMHGTPKPNWCVMYDVWCAWLRSGFRTYQNLMQIIQNKSSFWATIYNSFTRFGSYLQLCYKKFPIFMLVYARKTMFMDFSLPGKWNYYITEFKKAKLRMVQSGKKNSSHASSVNFITKPGAVNVLTQIM